MTSLSLKKTSLYETHHGLEAKMIPFADFLMPVQYKSTKEEIQSVRNGCGVFDVSHMGEFFITGKEAIQFVDYLITNKFQEVSNGKAVYSPMCNKNGGVVDDLIAYKINEQKVLLCVNANNIEKDWKWINQFIRDFDCQIENLSDSYTLLAVQGPDSEKIITSIYSEHASEISKMPFYSIYQIPEQSLILARTGYTGEDGFEIFCLNENAEKTWSNLTQRNATPCGLAARDTLRIEVCYPLYGNELNDEITPIEAGLKWTVNFEKKDFIGKEALQNLQPKQRLVKLSIHNGIPRKGHKILSSIKQKEIGIITSGSYSPTLSHGVAMGFVKKDEYLKEDDLLIEIRGKQYPSQKHRGSFLKGGHK